MFYLPQALLTWIVAIRIIQWRRTRELLIYGFYGAYLCAVQDKVGYIYQLWDYRDTGPLDSHVEISALIAVSAAPLFGIYFAQGLKPGGRPPWRRILIISTIAMVPETIGLYSGHIAYGPWWNWGLSVLAHLLIWFSFWALHRWLTSPSTTAVPTR